MEVGRRTWGHEDVWSESRRQLIRGKREGKRSRFVPSGSAAEHKWSDSKRDGGDQETTGSRLGTWTRNIPLGKTIQLEKVTQLKHCREVPRETHAFTVTCWWKSRCGDKHSRSTRLDTRIGEASASFSSERKEASHKGQFRKGVKLKENRPRRAKDEGKRNHWNIPKTSHNPRFKFWVLLVKVPHFWIYQAAWMQPYRSPHP